MLLPSLRVLSVSLVLPLRSPLFAVRSSLSPSSLMGCGASSDSVWTADRLDALWHRLQGRDNTAPLAELQLGGVIKLSSYGCLFNPAPLLDHSWLQGRMSPAEWRDLIVSFNNCQLSLLEGTWWWSSNPHMRALDTISAEAINRAVDAHLADLKPKWRARGINIEYTHATAPAGFTPRASALFFVVTQLAHMPVPVASALPAYAVPAEFGEGVVAPSGGAAPGGAFADVPKQILTSVDANEEPGASADDSSSSSAVSIPASALRFCPLCAAPVQPGTAGKRFCGDCGGAWR